MKYEHGEGDREEEEAGSWADMRTERMKGTVCGEEGEGNISRGWRLRGSKEDDTASVAERRKSGRGEGNTWEGGDKTQTEKSGGALEIRQ